MRRSCALMLLTYSAERLERVTVIRSFRSEPAAPTGLRFVLRAFIPLSRS